MSHRLILRLAAFVGLVFGIALMFAPDALLDAYGADSLNNPGRAMAMLYGALLTGFAVMNFTASRAPDIAEIHYVLRHRSHILISSISCSTSSARCPC